MDCASPRSRPAAWWTRAPETEAAVRFRVEPTRASIFRSWRKRKGCADLSSAASYSLNVTLVPQNHHPVCYLTIWPAGLAQPLISTMNSLDGRVKANAAIVPAGVSAGGERLCDQHHRRRARHRWLLRPVGSVHADVLSADALPCGRHPQEHLPARSGHAALVCRSGARLPGAERGCLQHSVERASVFAELHGDPVSGAGRSAWLSGSVAERPAADASGLDPEQSDGNVCCECGHRSGGHRWRDHGLRQQRHRSGHRHQRLLRGAADRAECRCIPRRPAGYSIRAEWATASRSPERCRRRWM